MSENKEKKGLLERAIRTIRFYTLLVIAIAAAIWVFDVAPYKQQLSDVLDGLGVSPCARLGDEMVQQFEEIIAISEPVQISRPPERHYQDEESNFDSRDYAPVTSCVGEVVGTDGLSVRGAFYKWRYGDYESRNTYYAFEPIGF